MPGGSSAAGSTLVPTSSFDNAAYQGDQARYIAGNFVSQLDKSNPYDIPVKGEYKFSDPLLTSGASISQLTNGRASVMTVR